MPRPRPVLLMTRPRDASKRFVEALPQDLADQLDTCIAPLIEIEPCVSVIDPGDAKGIILTSANAVRVAHQLGFDTNLPCFCVGEATASAARQAGWSASALGENADRLTEALIEVRPKTPLLHLHGLHTRGDVAERLTAAGLPTREIAIYDQPLLPLSEQALALLSGPAPVIAPLFSPRTARQFAQAAGNRPMVYAVTISEAATAALAGYSYGSVIQAARPDAAGMVRAIETSLAALSRVEGNGAAQ